MADVKRLLSIGVFVAASAIGHGSGQDRALDLLRKSMGRSFGVNVVSVILQRDPSGDGTFQRVKCERSVDGKSHHTVLQPLRLYGVESIDDGQRLRIYLPDDKLLLDQPSSQSGPDEVAFKLRLVAQNYQVKITDQSKVAGRPAVTITAIPNHRELETKRFTVDQQTGYPLKMEGVRKGAVRVYYDTKTIQFPKALDEGLFEIRLLGQVGKVRYSRPASYTTSESARSALGFQAVLPKELPLGFQIQELQSTQDPGWRALVVRLTDGLVRGTLYQWRDRGDGPNIKAYMDRTFREAGGIKFLLVSELDARQREQLLDAFTRQMSQPADTATLRRPGAPIRR